MVSEQRTRPPRESRLSLRRVLRTVRRRVYDRHEYLILRAGPLAEEPGCPAGVTLLRVSQAHPEGAPLATSAMRLADEPPEVPQRLAHGDEFFAWVDGERACCFGWVCFHDRHIGLYHYPEARGQAFLYNFYTDPAQRGRGLYPALLRQMRYLLGQEGSDSFLIDVRVSNLASIRGIHKGGFSVVGQVGFDTWLGHFQRGLHLRAGKTGSDD